MPTALRKDEAIVEAYAASLLKLKAPGHAEKCCSRPFACKWSERLVLNYGLLETQDTLRSWPLLNSVGTRP